MNVKKIIILASMFLIVCAAWTYADTYHYSDRIEIDGNPVMVSGSPWTDSQNADGNDLTNVSTFRHVSEQGKVLNLNFNNRSILNQVLDSSGYNFHANKYTGTANEPIYHSTGGFNNGGYYEFDGSADYMYIDDSDYLDFTTAFSIELWIRTSTSGTGGLISKMDTNDNAYLLVKSSENYANLYVANTSSAWQSHILGTTPLNDGNWHHIIGVYNETNPLKLYVDGVSEGAITGDEPATIRVNTQVIRIGKYSNVEYGGDMDEVVIYNRALSEDEAIRKYNQWTEGYDAFVYQQDIKVNLTGIFPQHDFYILSNQKLCWNDDCTAYEYWNGTHKLEVYP